MTDTTIKRALISVSNKTDILTFAKALHEQGVEILSTGGTATLLKNEGIPVQEVSDYTGFPEMMQGRLKTLHPKIHGGLLGRRGIDDEVMQSHDIPPIDLVVVNLYPFAETIQQPNCTLEKAVEQIDIGGPTMLRSAAKNYVSVAVVVEPADYPEILREMTGNAGRISFETRSKLAQKVFFHTAQYETTIANYLSQTASNNTQESFPSHCILQFTKKEDLRYGENPHQKAAFYIEKGALEPSISTAEQLQGKPLSYNNIADSNAALECVKSFNENPACVIVKHANPCGVAIANTQKEAYERAFATDPTSAFGGIIAFNQLLTTETTRSILEKQFLEVLIAPAIEEEAVTLLSKKPNIRVLVCGQLTPPQPAMDYHRINGGLLVQERDTMTLSPNNLKIVTQRQPSVQEFNDLLFAWEVAKYVKSNAIVYAKNRATIGIGAGQMSRVFSAIIAGLKAKDAGLEVSGSVMASDAFFPFRDAIDAAAEVGIAAIIQPGGSIRDAEVIEAADEAGIAMVFTGMRHFKH